MTAKSSPVFVRLAGVSKRFINNGATTTALDAVSITVHPGIITGLVGPDGAGKTTLLRLIAGLLRPDSGAVSVLGRDMAANPVPAQADLGYMPQRFGLYEDLTVLENMNLYARLHGIPDTEKQDIFDRLLRFTDLERFQKRMAGNLSGGMKQKLGLACTLLRKPSILLLDEPGVGVDPVSRRELWRMVNELVNEDTAVIWSTAYLDEAERCDEVFLLNNGALLFTGKPADLSRRMRGRTFLLKGVPGDRRTVLSEALKQPAILDATMQGSSIRLVLRANETMPLFLQTGRLTNCPAAAQRQTPNHAMRQTANDDAGTDCLKKIQLVSVAPRFEDAFLDILGGAPHGESSLSRFFAPVASGEHAYSVEARQLSKKYGSFYAAKDITFSVRRGEVFGLLGPNGAGKTTTFKMLCGLSRPSNGQARVSGLDLASASSKARGRIGYMAQKFSLYGGISVLRNLHFFAQAYGLYGKKREEAVAHMLELFELAPFAAQAAETLPLGYRQRLSLACALMHSPDVLFLDEPTSGVDPVARREFWMHINALVQKGVTVLVTTHFMDEAEFCDRIAFIFHGQVAALGTPDELKNTVAGPDLPEPTMEDAFVALIKNADMQEETRHCAQTR